MNATSIPIIRSCEMIVRQSDVVDKTVDLIFDLLKTSLYSKSLLDSVKRFL
jgi:hypothetical protein